MKAYYSIMLAVSKLYKPILTSTAAAAASAARRRAARRMVTTATIIAETTPMQISNVPHLWRTRARDFLSETFREIISGTNTSGTGGPGRQRSFGSGRFRSHRPIPTHTFNHEKCACAHARAHTLIYAPGIRMHAVNDK